MAESKYIDASAASEQKQRQKMTAKRYERQKALENEIKEFDKDIATGRSPLIANTYWLTRIFLIRAVFFVFAFAFLVALYQNKALIGHDGLLPANTHMLNLQSNYNGNFWLMVWNHPTLLWFVNYPEHIDYWLDFMATLGLCLSSFVLVVGGSNIIITFTVWILYHSIVNVGQRWYSFGWESQLLETCFLTMFLSPVLSTNPLPRETPPSTIVIYLFRWLLFRIMMGAGLIKIRGDKCWRDLTCMNYHYETQPVPNPISYYLHQTPDTAHMLETLGNHFIELIVPWMFFLFRPFRLFAGMVQIMFQVILIISGNLSFLNWLTIIPALALLDDRALSRLFTKSTVLKVWLMQKHEHKSKEKGFAKINKHIRQVWHIALLALVVCMSIPIVKNLLSPGQIMNTSFEPLRLVNTYGAFGSITKRRTEVVFYGTHSRDPSVKTGWQEYEFKCKPGALDKMPCFISPYHYRLDWLMWFAAFQKPEMNAWLYHLAGKFLINDEGATSLIAKNPFEHTDPPKWIKAEHFRYKYTNIGSAAARNGSWYQRKSLGEFYLNPMTLETAQDYVKLFGFMNSTVLSNLWHKRK